MGVITERERQKYFAYLDGVADGLNEARNDVNSVLDEIKAEIEQYQSDFDEHGTEYDRTAWQAYNRCLKIIDKYKAESEET